MSILQGKIEWIGSAAAAAAAAAAPSPCSSNKLRPYPQYPCYNI